MKLKDIDSVKKKTISCLPKGCLSISRNRKKKGEKEGMQNGMTEEEVKEEYICAHDVSVIASQPNGTIVTSSRNVGDATEKTFEPSYHVYRWSKKKKAGTEVWCSDAVSRLPTKKISPLVPDLFASYSGPDRGLAAVHTLNTTPGHKKSENIAGARAWNQKSRKAYGICMSLYDQHPINGKISGDPIADSFGVLGRKNNAFLVVADGVNWGEKSKLAARCAVYGCVKFVNEKLFGSGKPIKNTQEAFTVLLQSLDIAHETILEFEGGLTTLCAALVCPIKDSKQFVVCIVNVGDSLGFVFSKHHGIREITTGSHDIESERDIRDAGGALGPVNGKDPELNNLTCSMTIVDPGDIVYLTTDGISDNFDPVVTKIAVPKRRHSDPEISSISDSIDTSRRLISKDGRPEMSPHERHQYAVKEMERIIHEFELFTEEQCCAQELCGALLQHVLKLTDPKRKVLENPELYGKKLRSKDRKRRDSEIVSKMSRAPGKLDHATIVAYEVGNYHGNDDEDYEVESEDEAPESVMSTDAQNNIIVEETEDEGDSTSPSNSLASPINTSPLPSNVSTNTTFLHLHADIPFADDDIEEDDVTKETNQSNSNKGSNLTSGNLSNQNNKNQQDPAPLSGRSFVISRTPITSTSSTTTSPTHTAVTNSEGALETNKSTEGIRETSVQVHNSNNEHNNSPPTPVSNSSFIANQHQHSVETMATTVSANQHLPCDVVANEHACATEHAPPALRESTPVESLEFAQSVFPMDQYDGDEIFV